jgi:adenylate cyclase
MAQARETEGGSDRGTASNEARREEWTRIQNRFGAAMGIANAVGALLTFIFLVWLAPIGPQGYDPELTLPNGIVFACYLLLVFPVVGLLIPRLLRPLADWWIPDRPPTADERERALRHPLLQLEVHAAAWAGAAVLFGVLNASIESPRLGFQVALGILLGGGITCAIGYLLAERVLRPVVALALAQGVPEHPATPGVETRMLLAWALGAGVPLLGVAAVALGELTGEEESAERVAGAVLFLAVAGLAFGLLAIRLAARSVADPVEAVRGAQRDVESGELEAEVPVYDGSEVGLLQAGFNRMVSGLRERERLRDLFGRYVGEDVARHALERGAELGGEVRPCAALFVDVVGSTALAAARPPSEVVELLNQFFAVVVEETREWGGWVNKFEGDAALCVFGVPVAEGDPATNALAGGRELRERLERETPDLRAAIGISFGEVVAGNVGAAERYEYTVIGDPVNEAARLSELAKERPSRVLASETIVSAASREESAHWSLAETVTLRGRDAPTRLAEPRTPGSNRS